MNIRRILFGTATAVAVVVTGACSDDTAPETSTVVEQPGRGGNAPIEAVNPEDAHETPKSPKDESVHVGIVNVNGRALVSKQCDGTTLIYIFSNGVGVGGMAAIEHSDECK